MRNKRIVEVAVVSDVHLGTFGCRAEELLNYLKSIEPGVLILNGDIIDIWQFNKRYFPTAHMKVVKYLTSLLTNGTKIYYITGNHDEMLRKFTGFRVGSFELVNKLVLDLGGEKAWFFHGDVFDVTMKHSKWLAKLGGMGYDFLIMVNTLVNWIYQRLGRERISFSKKVKDSVKGAVKHVNNFEQTAAEIAIANDYDYVVCGHIHKPQIRDIENRKGDRVTYLNSGDWIENLTALEYNEGAWSIYEYHEDLAIHNQDQKMEIHMETELQVMGLDTDKIFNDLLEEFRFHQPS